MSIDYATMSRERALDLIDTIPSAGAGKSQRQIVLLSRPHEETVVATARGQAKERIYEICVAGLEIYCIHSDRMQQRLRPLQN